MNGNSSRVRKIIGGLLVSLTLIGGVAGAAGATPL